MRVIDSHTHLMNRKPETLVSMAEGYGYDKFCALGIPCEGDDLNTLECLRVKALVPTRAYCYGGMAYPKGVAPDGKEHETQLRLMMDAGFDGWKILESKPATYKRLQLPLDGDVFARAFALAEEARFPITWHAGDPATFWDEKTAPRFAVENGWLCVGEGFPTLKEIYRQVESVLKRHPQLRVSMAHLYFTSDDRAHAERLLDEYENFCLDLTPGSEMYHAFLADREGWAAFFTRYKDKLVFGTDMVDDAGDVVFGDQNAVFAFVKSTLLDAEGLNLPKDAQQAIFADNFERIAGVTPRALNTDGILAYAQWLSPRLSPTDRARCKAMTEKIVGI